MNNKYINYIKKRELCKDVFINGYFDEKTEQGIQYYYDTLKQSFLENKKTINNNTNVKGIDILCKPISFCNQKCFYCFSKINHTDKLNIIDKKIILDFLIKLLQEFNEINWIWHGPEILQLDKAWLEDIIYQMYIIVNQQANKKISFTLQTNGSLLTEEWYSFFDKYNIKCSVSWDGEKNVLSRGNKLDLSWLNIINGIILVINKHNYKDLINTYKLLKNSNVKEISFNFAYIHKNMDSKMLYEEDFDEVLAEYKKYVQYVLWHDGPLDRTIENLIYLSLGEYGRVCNFIDCLNFNFLTLNAKGEIWKCDNENCKDFLLGEATNYINYDNLLPKNNSLYSYYNIFEECSNCIYNNICKAGCLNCRITESNSQHPYSLHCQLIKELVPFIFNELYNLSPKDFIKLNYNIKVMLIKNQYLPNYYLNDLIKEES